MAQPHPTPVEACIALGGNIGDVAAAFSQAIAALNAVPGVHVLHISSNHTTAPVGPIPQASYLNAAAVLQTTLSPHDLLAALHTIERSHGRNRATEQRWGPRTLDLDLLTYGGLSIYEPGLTLPHPRLHERLFVLAPLAEIAPDLVVPGLGKSVEELKRANECRAASISPEAEVDDAIHRLAIPPTELRKLTQEEAEPILADIEARFVSGEPRVWWNGLRNKESVVNEDRATLAETMPKLAPTTLDSLLFIPDNDDGGTLPVYEGCLEAILKVLFDTFYYEYYIHARDAAWFVASNDHNQLIVARPTKLN